jgi:hypothetical protein
MDLFATHRECSTDLADWRSPITLLGARFGFENSLARHFPRKGRKYESMRAISTIENPIGDSTNVSISEKTGTSLSVRPSARAFAVGSPIGRVDFPCLSKCQTKSNLRCLTLQIPGMEPFYLLTYTYVQIKALHPVIYHSSNHRD